METVLVVFLMYTVLTALGILVAKILVLVLFKLIRRPDKEEKQRLNDYALESLEQATELRMDATALYNQLAGERGSSRHGHKSNQRHSDISPSDTPHVSSR